MDLISVIVPVYNVEKYLDRCVQSIVNQTYQNLEIILVDDGSPDRCPAMCDAWAAKDSRIKVIHKENGGVSAARNVGIASANGEFVCFVDSDDWVDPQYVYLLHYAADKFHSDVAVCKMLLVQEEMPVPVPYCGDPDMQMWNTEMVMTSLVCGGDYQGGPCDKLYRRQLIQEVQFPEGYRHEDEFFAHRVALQAERFVFVDAPLYIYRQWETSFMHRVTLERLDALEAALERLTLIRNRYQELYHKGKAAFCVACVANCRMVLGLPENEAHQFLIAIQNYRRQISFGLKEICSYSPKAVLYILASKLCLVSFSKLLNLRKRVNT